MIVKYKCWKCKQGFTRNMNWVKHLFQSNLEFEFELCDKCQTYFEAIERELKEKELKEFIKRRDKYLKSKGI